MNKRSKILLVTLDFPPLLGGVANYYFNRVKTVNATGEEIIVLADDSNFVIPAQVGIPKENSWIPDQVGDDKKEELIFRKNFFTKFIWPHWLPLIWQIYKIVKKEKINKIWVGQILPVGPAVWLVCWFINRGIFFRRFTHKQDDLVLDYFVTCHGNDLLRAKNQPRKFKLAKRILKDAEFVEANSEFTKNILINDFEVRVEKIKIVYPVNTLKKEMVDEKKVSELREKYNLIGKKVLLTVGRLVESKGIDLVLQALPKVWQSVPNLIYMVIGEGPNYPELVRISAKFFPINDKIIFVGAVPHSELPNYYAIANAFILTPYKNFFGDTESFGIVYLEAKEFGLPIIAGNVGGALEIAKDYKQMYLINSESQEEIIENIIEIIK